MRHGPFVASARWSREMLVVLNFDKDPSTGAIASRSGCDMLSPRGSLMVFSGD